MPFSPSTDVYPLRVALIHNPTAGEADHDRDTLIGALSVAGHQVDYRSIKDDGWEEALAGRPELIAVAGGDGTVAKVFKQLAGTSLPVTVIPLGSANNIADTVGFASIEREHLVGAWPSFVLHTCDLGEISAPWGKRRFVESAGGGLFGDFFARAEDTESDAGDKVRLGLELLRDILPRVEAAFWEVDLDGRDLSAELLAVEALNVRETGPELRLAPAVDPTDGLLDVVLVAPGDRELLCGHVETRLEGDIPPELDLTIYRGRELTLRAPGTSLLHVDDEPWPSAGQRHSDGPLVLRTGGEQVRVLAPQGQPRRTTR